MTALTAASNLNHNLRAIVRQLEALGGGITGDQVTAILARADLTFHDVDAFVTTKLEGYSRRRVARTEAFEMLVMTWLPGQGSGAHDHADSVSAFKMLRGTAEETRYAQAVDTLVDPVGTRQLREGEVGIDPGNVIHAVRNEQDGGLLVSVHVYAPPIRELRRFTLRAESPAPVRAFLRRRQPSAPRVAIVGGGYSGAMTAVQLVRKATRSGMPVHLVILDRQTSIAEGAAYRTPDPRHLLNVPASGMSAWPDRSDDFLEWAKQRDSSVVAHSFMPRRTYGEYLRTTFLDAIAEAGPQVSVEIRREEADTIERRGQSGWRVHCKQSQPIEADIVVLATGHRSLVDPLSGRWSGSRARYIEDPWSSLTLTAIEKAESVCLLGTGLTAIDVLQSLGGSARSARVMAVSRRGLLPAAHAPAPLVPIDPRGWLEPLLRTDTEITTRALTRNIRSAVRGAEAAGQDGRQVIDGLRPYISQIWSALSPQERTRFLRHARAFWEVARHRMAPTVAEEVTAATQAGVFSVAAARILSARGDMDGATLTVRRRGQSVHESHRFDWIVNCTGPGSGRKSEFPPSVARLIDTGYLEADPDSIGVRSTPEGHAIVDARVIGDLILIGSLRKPDNWESTAVPELRLQAALAADAIIQQVTRSTSPSVHAGSMNSEAAQDACSNRA
jgi:uncharacterized NAD(P)/FAD-binding protein YdhS/predicted metal-dependent enzyme (double-stranded beta helix superfamily)